MATTLVQAAGSQTAGGLLRRARESQGLHLESLATSIKVPARKLELLEADRYDELPDATFVRGLAKAVCRVLKTDAEPVLALLPRATADDGLDHVAAGLNQPFRDRPGHHVPSDWSTLATPALWGTGLLLIAAAAVYFLPDLRLSSEPAAPTSPTVTTVPSGTTESNSPQNVSAPAVEVAGAAASAPEVAAPTGAAAASAVAMAAANPAATSPVQPVAAPEAAAIPVPSLSMAAGTGALQLSASAPSWISVVDAQGRSLLSRVLQAGETVGLDGVPPFKVVVGNVSGTKLSFRGQAVDLGARARDNVAKLELK